MVECIAKKDDFNTNGMEVGEYPKTITIDVPVTFPEHLFIRLKAWADAHNTTIEQELSRYLPIYR